MQTRPFTMQLLTENQRFYTKSLDEWCTIEGGGTVPPPIVNRQALTRLLRKAVPPLAWIMSYTAPLCCKSQALTSLHQNAPSSSANQRVLDRTRAALLAVRGSLGWRLVDSPGRKRFRPGLLANSHHRVCLQSNWRQRSDVLQQCTGKFPILTHC